MQNREAETLDSILHPLARLGLVKRGYETKEEMRDRYPNEADHEEKWKFYEGGGVYSGCVSSAA